MVEQESERMSRIIVRFRRSADVSTRVQHAIIDICDVFGFAPPWFNDDVWFEDRGRETIIIGSGYNVTDVETRISIIKDLYGDCIKEIYEEESE